MTECFDYFVSRKGIVYFIYSGKPYRMDKHKIEPLIRDDSLPEKHGWNKAIQWSDADNYPLIFRISLNFPFKFYDN